MKELATILLKSLSANPENVVVEEKVENTKIYLTTKVSAEDKANVEGFKKFLKAYFHKVPDLDSEIEKIRIANKLLRMWNR